MYSNVTAKGKRKSCLKEVNLAIHDLLFLLSQAAKIGKEKMLGEGAPFERYCGAGGWWPC